jgi:carbonic anhydrase
MLLATSLMQLLSAVDTSASDEKSVITADRALHRLMDGNARFVSGDLIHPDQSAKRRSEVLSQQNPFAVVIGCSDSRVPLEIIFDQGIGDIFVIRTAGQVMDEVTIGSVEYAVEHLNVPLTVVLGHDSCGAIKAVLEGGEAPGHIGSLIEAIKPAVDEAKRENVVDQVLNASININIRNIVSNLRRSSPILSQKIKDGRLLIVGARYHLDSGRVDLIE